MSGYKFRIFMLSLILSSLVSACTPPPENKPPVITLGERFVVPASEQKEIPITVTDPENDAVTCTWSAQRGVVPSGPQPCSKIVYTAPSVSGGDTISVIADDGHGNVVPNRLPINVVQPATPTVTLVPSPTATLTLIPSPTATSTSTSTPTPLVPTIVITQPIDILTCTNPSEELFCRFEIKGTAGGVPSFVDLRVYTFVFPLEPPGEGWYLQRPPSEIGSGGTWAQAPAYIGNVEIAAETGDTLRIRAALVKEDATYRGKPLGELPTVTILQAIGDIEGVVALSDMVNLTVNR